MAHNPPSTTICYRRVSTARQKEAETIEAQTDRCQRLVERFAITPLPYGPDGNGWLTDDGVSGTLLEGRAFSSLIDDIESRRVKVDSIVVYRLDRISRIDKVSQNPEKVIKSHADNARILGVLTAHNVKIIDEEGINDPGSMTTAVKMLVANEEFRAIRERTISGKHKHFEEGEFCKGGKPPYGYRYVSTRGDSKRGKYKLELDTVDAENLKRIYGWVIEGGYTHAASKATDASILTPMHRTTKRKNAADDWSPTRWNAVTVLNLVKRAGDYLGEITYQFQGKAYTIKAPAIIDLETYMKLQRKQKERKVKHTRTIFMSTGYVDCGCSPDTHVHNKAYGNGNYACCARKCSPSIKSDKFNQLLWQATCFRLMELLKEEKSSQKNGNGWDERIQPVEKQLEEVNSKLKKLVDMALDGFDPETITLKKNELNEVKRNLQHQLEGLKQGKKDHAEKKQAQKTLEDQLEAILDEVIHQPTLDRKRQILGDLLQGERVVVTKWGSNMVELRFPAFGSLSSRDILLGDGLFITFLGLQVDDPNYAKFMQVIAALKA